MSFTYTTNIPAAANNPSNDQPNMLTNTNSIASIIAVDHVGFNTATSGQHEQCTFPGVVTPPTPAGAASVLFPALGVADNTHPVLSFQNVNLTFPISLVRAYASVVGSTGVADASQTLGIATIVRNSSGNYTITLNANVVSGTSYGVFVGYNGTLTQTYRPTITSATVFNILFNPALDPTTFFFTVTQL